MSTSAELTGGAGFTYEDAVVARYLAALLTGTAAPGLEGGVVDRVAQQQAPFGHPLDDVIIEARLTADERRMRCSLQVKRTLRLTVRDGDFAKVIGDCWHTLQQPTFQDDVDRVGLAANEVAVDPARAFDTVCQWARVSPHAVDFVQRFAPGSPASEAQREIYSSVRTLANAAAGEPISDAAVHRLFRHLVLIRFDFLTVGSRDQSAAIADLQRALVADQVGQAPTLWAHLQHLARDGAGRRAIHDRAALLRSATGYRFVALPVWAQDLEALASETARWVGQVPETVAGTHVARDAVMDRVRSAITAHRLTLITGAAGVGKTVVLRRLVGDARPRSALLLAANRLGHTTWATHARALGMRHTSIAPMLVEVAATEPVPVLYVDGLDRIATEHRCVLTDVLADILAHPDLANWRVVATTRNSGIEPLRNWLPAAWLTQGGLGVVEVADFDDQEAAALAQEQPALRALLLSSNPSIRALARRPFFAAVLAADRAASNTTLATEVDLASAWWQRGGHNAIDPTVRLARQQALLELARTAARQLGQPMRLDALTAAAFSAVASLEGDGVLQTVRPGHVQFAHDIFFEWAYLHVLRGEGEAWAEALQTAGQSPALGRCVELLSQVTYADGARWEEQLRQLEGETGLRPQWVRAWLLGPLLLPTFAGNEIAFTRAVFDANHRRGEKVLVWMLAEKTIPNPRVLSHEFGSLALSAASRLRLADVLGWPSDVPAWQRLLNWVLDHVTELPDRLLSHVVALMTTWQSLFSDFTNFVSERLLTQAVAWLNAIEAERTSRWPQENSGEPSPPMPWKHAEELRGLVLRASRSYPALVEGYLQQVLHRPRRNTAVFREVMSHAAWLVPQHAGTLVDVARQELLHELPDERRARQLREARRQTARRAELSALPESELTQQDRWFLAAPPSLGGFRSDHEWDHLAIGAEHQGYFPASPRREPFHSLLTHTPSIGRHLIRDLTNHATTAWRQLHDHEQAGTPLSLELDFPWGQQSFWGTSRHYKWSRGHGGPQALECALMSLDAWAFSELSAGRLPDDIIQEVLEGHTSVAVLAIAAQIALHTQHVSATTLPLVSSRRLWSLDLERALNEGSFLSASLIGFNPGPQDAHQQAVREAAERPMRKCSIRDLVPFFVLGADRDLQAACRAALERFPDVLELEYREEAADLAFVRARQREGEIWREWGRPENWTTHPVAGREGVVAVQLESPQATSADVQAAVRDYAQMGRELTLWQFVERCFETSVWPVDIAPGDAMARAIAIAESAPADDADLRSVARGAIAGTAAALVCFADAPALVPWAIGTLEGFRDWAEEPDSLTFSGSVIPWHPKLFVARAWGARVRSGNTGPNERLDLFQLAAHQLDGVALVAIGEIAACWRVDPHFAWCGLGLAWRLAQYRGPGEQRIVAPAARAAAEMARREQAVIAARRQLGARPSFAPWAQPAPLWTDSGQRRRSRRGQEGSEWTPSGAIWLEQFAAAVLQRLPISDIAHSAAADVFFETVDRWVHWTLHAANPDGSDLQVADRDRTAERLYAWDAALGQVLAMLAPLQPLAQFQARYLAPILAQPDDSAFRLLQPFAGTLAAARIIDLPRIDDDALQLLQVVAQRTLAHADLRDNSGRRGSFRDWDGPAVVRSLLFVEIDGASGATRFANGNWTELPRVLPLIDAVVRGAGSHPYVMQQFLTLCERAGMHYPAEVYADQMLHLMTRGALPAAWMGTALPARIASMVQAHADAAVLSSELRQQLLRLLDALVDLGDRRSAALQQCDAFRRVRVPAGSAEL